MLSSMFYEENDGIVHSSKGLDYHGDVTFFLHQVHIKPLRLDQFVQYPCTYIYTVFVANLSDLYPFSYCRNLNPYII